MRQAADTPYAMPTPAFGGTVDYTKGTFNIPPTPGGLLTSVYSQPYGKIPTGTRTPPGYGMTPAIGKDIYQTTTLGGAKKPEKKKKRRDYLNRLSGMYP